jgi:dihydrofolate reductase
MSMRTPVEFTMACTPAAHGGSLPADVSTTLGRTDVRNGPDMVIWRHLFDMMNGWDGTPPAGEHVVVVSHRPKPDGWHPEASYHFVDDVAAAVAKAKELAGERTVAVAAGDVGGQALALGLVDEVAMDVVPVVFGSGKRYFGSVDGQHLMEDPDVVIRGDRVLHLRYRVHR